MIGSIIHIAQGTVGSLWSSLSTFVQETPLDKETAREPFQFILTKQCFEMVMNNPHQFQEFKDFCLASHCHENILFYEAVKELEDVLIRKLPGYVGPTALQRFVHSSNSSTSANELPPIVPIAPAKPSQKSSPIAVPPAILPHFLYFYSCYFTPNAPIEINLPSTTINAIANKMMNSGSGGVTTDIFDKAVDDVMGMIYYDVFSKYVESKAAAAAVALSETPAGMPRDVANVARVPTPPPSPELVPSRPPRLIPLSSSNVRSERRLPTPPQTPHSASSFDIDMIRPHSRYPFLSSPYERDDELKSVSGISFASMKSNRTIMSIKSKLHGAKKKMGKLGKAVSGFTKK